MSGASGLRKHGHTTDGDGGTITGGSGGVVDHTTYAQLDTGRRSLVNEFNDAGVLFGSVASRDATLYSGRHVLLEPGSSGAVNIDTGQGLIVLGAATDRTAVDNGQLYWNSATKQLRMFRYHSNPAAGGLWHDVGAQGWAADAYPIGFLPNGTYTTAVNLAANGGAMAVPISVPGPMKVHALEFWNTDSTLAREWEIGLYFDGGLSATAVMHYDSNEFGGGGTVSSADVRSTLFATPPVIPAGIAWAVIRNTHASNTLGVGTLTGAGPFATSALGDNRHRTKTLASFLGAATTLDLSGSWSSASGIPGVALRGRVLGSSSAF